MIELGTGMFVWILLMVLLVGAFLGKLYEMKTNAIILAYKRQAKAQMELQEKYIKENK